MLEVAQNAGSGCGSATAVAHPNIALVKYWGKRDEELIIPFADSLSMTLDIFPTTTAVTVATAAAAGGSGDTVSLNSQPAPAEMVRRVSRVLDLVRALSGRGEHAIVDTHNTVPTGAGLASSAAGMAALAVAGARAYGLELSPTALSRLARRGSGSASRSIFARFAVWHAGAGKGGEADRTSFAEPVTDVALDLALVVGLVDVGPKSMSSRDAMRHTVTTSPLYPAWMKTNTTDLAAMRAALAAGDLTAVGEIAEHNALGMHATMLAARPAVRYLSAGSLALLDAVAEVRRQGVAAFATMDAGPNVKVLCDPGDAGRVADAMQAVWPGMSVAVARPGPGATLGET